jgi:hypothetical protein
VDADNVGGVLVQDGCRVPAEDDEDRGYGCGLEGVIDGSAHEKMRLH